MISYHDLLAAVAVRINALGNVDIPEWNATDAAGLQVVYSQRPLIDEMFGSSIFPMNAIRDAIIETEGRLARAIAYSTDQTQRAYVSSVTGALASGAELPSLDANSVPIIGSFGEVKDQDETVMTRMPVPVLRNRLQTTGVYLVNPYYFALAGQTILHTSTTVTIECCVYSAQTQTDLFNRDAEILLSDSLAEAYIDGSCAMLFRDDEWSQQAQQFGTYFTTTLAQFPPAKLEQAAA